MSTNPPTSVPAPCALPTPTPLWQRLALLFLLLLAFLAGLQLRAWAWDATSALHFTSDIERGFYWGHQATLDGYPNLYERMAREQNPASWVWLDYAPLRLLVMQKWAAWEQLYSSDGQWHPDYAFNRPILLFNTLMELIAAIGVFLLVRQFGTCAWGHPKMRALFAALLLWFNPALILSAHGWPTWDAWIIPFYLFTILLAARNRWFIAGVVIGIGAMFKGQQFFVAPIFVIWPFVQGRPIAALRWIVGLMLTIALLAMVWLLTYLPPGAMTGVRTVDWLAVVWVVGATLGTGAGTWWMARHKKNISAKSDRSLSPLLLGGLLIAAALSWPFWMAITSPGLWVTLALATMLSLLTWRLPRSDLTCVAGAALAVTLLLCMPLFHGSYAWIDCAFFYGTHHWPWMTTGPASNLPALLQAHLGWGNPPMDANEALFHLPAGLFLGLRHTPLAVSLRAALFALYLMALGATGIGIARQHERGDARFLVAITAPWLMFFCLPAQIHERYLLFAAGVGAVMAGHSLRMGFLGVFLALVALIMTLHAMVTRALDDGQIGPASMDRFMSLKKMLDATHPDIAWTVLACAAVVMYLTMAPKKAAPCALSPVSASA